MATTGAIGRELVVLIVSDNADNRTLIQGALSEDFLVANAESAESALSAQAKERPDAIVVDLALAGDSAFELLRSLRREHRDWTPVLAVVQSDGDVALAVRAMRAGATDVLAADYGVEELRRRAHDLVEGSLVGRRHDRRVQEVNAVYEALPDCGGNVSQLARETGIPRSTLYGLLKETGFWGSDE